MPGESVTHQALRLLGMTLAFIFSLWLLLYALVGLWHPNREWLRPLFVASPFLLAGWWMICKAIDNRGQTGVATSLSLIPAALVAVYVVLS
jgi:hypothetical protein